MQHWVCSFIVCLCLKGINGLNWFLHLCQSSIRVVPFKIKRCLQSLTSLTKDSFSPLHVLSESFLTALFGHLGCSRNKRWTQHWHIILMKLIWWTCKQRVAYLKMEQHQLSFGVAFLPLSPTFPLFLALRIRLILLLTKARFFLATDSGR